MKDLPTEEEIRMMRKLLVSLKGGDPDAQQAISAFMRFESETERANLRSIDDVLGMAYLQVCHEFLFPENPNCPFSIAARAYATATMGYKGKKSDQLVEMVRQTPNMGDLQMLDDKKGGFLSRFRGGGEE